MKISKKNANSITANSAEYRSRALELNRDYQAIIAANNAEAERKHAEIDAESARKLAKYKQESDTRSAQYAQEQATREAKQAKCDSFKAEYPDLDTYKSKQGNLSELWSAYLSAKKAYETAMSIWRSATASGSEKRISIAEKTANEKMSAMNSAHDKWSASNASLSNSYNAKFREACL